MNSKESAKSLGSKGSEGNLAKFFSTGGDSVKDIGWAEGESSQRSIISVSNSEQGESELFKVVSPSPSQSKHVITLHCCRHANKESWPKVKVRFAFVFLEMVRHQAVGLTLVARRNWT